MTLSIKVYIKLHTCIIICKWDILNNQGFFLWKMSIRVYLIVIKYEIMHILVINDYTQASFHYIKMSIQKYMFMYDKSYDIK
jgi:hypothetical protein